MGEESKSVGVFAGGGGDPSAKGSVKEFRFAPNPISVLKFYNFAGFKVSNIKNSLHCYEYEIFPFFFYRRDAGRFDGHSGDAV